MKRNENLFRYASRRISHWDSGAQDRGLMITPPHGAGPRRLGSGVLPKPPFESRSDCEAQNHELIVGGFKW